MLRNRKPRILAIDPGTREMGVAVLENGHLLYSGVETCPVFASPKARLRQSRLVVVRLLRDFRPEVLAVEKTFVGRNRSATLLNVLGNEIVALGRRHGITIASLGSNTVKKVVVGNGLATKVQVAEAVAETFPQLKPYLPPLRKWKERHHFNMFDAVAIGLTASRALKGRMP